MVKIVFDMGESHTRVAGSDDGRTLSEPVIFATDQIFESGANQLISAITQQAGERPVTKIIGGVAGTLNPDHSQLVAAPNLPGWLNKPIATRLSERFNASVTLQNDTALVGLGEACVGAGRGKQLVSYLTVSTGVNGVNIINQKIQASTWGFELGYQIIGADSQGAPLRLEPAIGGHSLAERYGKPAGEIKDALVWTEIIHHLAIGLHNTILHWSPELVVLGGSMMQDIPIAQVSTEVTKLLTAFPHIPEFRLAELGERGGLLGALAFDATANS